MEKKYVLVMFDQQDNYNGKQYAYFTELDLEVDDRVVVQPNGIFKVATVHTVQGLTANQRAKADQWVVCKVDAAAHAERIRRAGLAQEIRNKLHEAKEAAEETMIYQHLAKSDPSIAKLLAELAEVDDTVVLLESPKKS